MRLMLGKAGQIVCTLKIQNGYPTSGEVSVAEIHGADPAIIFQDSLVSGLHIIGSNSGVIFPPSSPPPPPAAPSADWRR